jgi:hypothetical protein
LVRNAVLAVFEEQSYHDEAVNAVIEQDNNIKDIYDQADYKEGFHG